MRHQHKSWQDKRPGFTRRVRWYDPDHDWLDIKVTIEDQDGLVRLYFKTKEQAQAAFDAFKAGDLTFLNHERWANEQS